VIKYLQGKSSRQPAPISSGQLAQMTEHPTGDSRGPILDLDHKGLSSGLLKIKKKKKKKIKI
jgi:hypothetical protein